jgi:hypothetical protein
LSRGRLPGVCLARAAGLPGGIPHLERRFRVPEKLVSLECDPDGQHDQSCRAQRDRRVDQHQCAGDDPADKNPDSDDDQRSAEPDHL